MGQPEPLSQENQHKQPAWASIAKFSKISQSFTNPKQVAAAVNVPGTSSSMAPRPAIKEVSHCS